MEFGPGSDLKLYARDVHSLAGQRAQFPSIWPYFRLGSRHPLLSRARPDCLEERRNDRDFGTVGKGDSEKLPCEAIRLEPVRVCLAFSYINVVLWEVERIYFFFLLAKGSNFSFDGITDFYMLYIPPLFFGLLGMEGTLRTCLSPL